MKYTARDTTITFADDTGETFTLPVTAGEIQIGPEATTAVPVAFRVPPVTYRLKDVRIGWPLRLHQRNPPPYILRQWMRGRGWANREIRRMPLSLLRYKWKQEAWRPPRLTGRWVFGS